MTVIRSTLDTRSASFKENAARLRGLVDDLRAKAEVVRLGGGRAQMERHVGRGKLAPRERVRQLLDPGTPFLEIGQLAGLEMYSGEIGRAHV